MYCNADSLKEIRNNIVGLRLHEIYPDWRNGVIYLQFADGLHTVVVRVKNNYYAGMEIFRGAGND